MKFSFIIFLVSFLFRSFDLDPKSLLYANRNISGIEEYAQRFSKLHKTWTEDNITISTINKIFADSLTKFYNENRGAFNNLVLRLENVLDTENGKRVASFECWDHIVDNKKLRAHVYAYVPDTLKKLFIGNDYILLGKIEKFDVLHGAGYNKTDNTCDVGIITIIPADIIHLKGHNVSGNIQF